MVRKILILASFMLVSCQTSEEAELASIQDYRIAEGCYFNEQHGEIIIGGKIYFVKYNHTISDWDIRFVKNLGRVINVKTDYYLTHVDIDKYEFQKGRGIGFFGR